MPVTPSTMAHTAANSLLVYLRIHEFLNCRAVTRRHHFLPSLTVLKQMVQAHGFKGSIKAENDAT